MFFIFYSLSSHFHFIILGKIRGRAIWWFRLAKSRKHEAKNVCGDKSKNERWLLWKMPDQKGSREGNTKNAQNGPFREKPEGPFREKPGRQVQNVLQDGGYPGSTIRSWVLLCGERTQQRMHRLRAEQVGLGHRVITSSRNLRRLPWISKNKSLCLIAPRSLCVWRFLPSSASWNLIVPYEKKRSLASPAWSFQRHQIICH